MKADSSVIAALDDCLKYERTLHQCYGQHHAYFARWRIHRLESWMAWQQDAACKRVKALELRINILDTIPGNELWEVEVQPVETAADIMKPIDYFMTLLTEAVNTYNLGMAACTAQLDSVSCGLLGCHKVELEDQIQRFEAKIRKIQLVGAQAYIGEHFHKGTS